jgi:hypothetical protein
MAKKSIKWIPGLGWFSECNEEHSVPVREGIPRARESIG